MRQTAYNKHMAKKKRYEMEELFQALSHETRLKLLHLLGSREVCVCELVEALKEPQPKISQHLGHLRRAGIVEARREGKWMHYHIVNPPHEGATRILAEALRWLKEDRPPGKVASQKSDCCATPSVQIARNKAHRQG